MYCHRIRIFKEMAINQHSIRFRRIIFTGLNYPAHDFNQYYLFKLNHDNSQPAGRLPRQNQSHNSIQTAVESP
jgi:hypothetical protein